MIMSVAPADVYGLDIDHLRFDVVRQALQRIDLWSPAAENLCLGTALHESHARYLRQLGHGPALGLWQMERPTHDDIHANYLKYNRELREKVNDLAGKFSGEMPDASELVGNLMYAAAMCRVHYRRVKQPLPMASDSHGLAQYWKAYYNTWKGKGTIAQALPHFQRATEIRS